MIYSKYDFFTGLIIACALVLLYGAFFVNIEILATIVMPLILIGVLIIFVVRYIFMV